MSRKVKVALGQITSRISDVEHNVKKAVEFIGQAANKGADIICLPELFATGYNLNILEDKVISLSREHVQFISDKMSKGAKDNNIYEIPYFAEGWQYPVFNTTIGKVGILICYDAGFPEAARTLCLKGAEIIFIPAAWKVQDENSWLLNVPSRALENQLYTIGVNRSGHEGDLDLLGKSMVCNPYGEVIMQMDYDADEVAVCEIDLDEVEKCRCGGGYLEDRRPNIYQL